MTDNIKRLFQQMNDRTKEEALDCLKTEFNVKNRRLVRNEWMKGGRIPEAFQQRIVALFQTLLRKQAADIER